MGTIKIGNSRKLKNNFKLRDPTFSLSHHFQDMDHEIGYTC